jgi:hypothetical protein
MTNDEVRMTKKYPGPNDQTQAIVARLTFDIRHWSLVRHSGFVIRHSHSLAGTG